MPTKTSQKNPKTILQTYYGYSSFRPLQEDIIQNTLQGQDSLVLMPTGGGKSLCYQIPALLRSGLAVVVSPLIALMKDQVGALQANGIKAAYVNSSLDASAQASIEDQASKGELDLLYMAPERLNSGRGKGLLKKMEVALIAIDEAHCVSQWGHDFRPDYQALSFLKQQFPQVPLMALTATADPHVKEDIVQVLFTSQPSIYQSSFNRRNLFLSVKKANKRKEQLVDFLDDQPRGASGIVYCLSRKGTETVAQHLKEAGFNARAYHAGLEHRERKKVQDDFLSDKLKIVCATIAFGMGIDKSNVRFVLHYNLPKNIESYYQEIGRAGRDGAPAQTLLFYSFSDVINLRRFIEDSKQKEVLEMKLDRMQNYAQTRQCRRKPLLSYFGEHLQEDCGNCDNCLNPPVLVDATRYAQMALSALLRLERMGQSIGMQLLVDLLRGSKRRDIVEYQLDQIKTYGAGRELSQDVWLHYILEMLNAGLMAMNYKAGGTLMVSPAGRSFIQERDSIQLSTYNTKEKAKALENGRARKVSKKEQWQNGLIEALKQTREEQAQKAELKPYQVLGDPVLWKMAEDLPLTKERMEALEGMSQSKLAQFGKAFAASLVDYLIATSHWSLQKKGRTQLITYAYYARGHEPQAIAEARGLALSTIAAHLVDLSNQSYPINLQEFVSEEKLQLLKAAKAQMDQKEEAEDTLSSQLNGQLNGAEITIGLQILRAATQK